MKRIALSLAFWLISNALAAAPLVAPEGTQPGALTNAAPPADTLTECGSCHSGSRDDEERLFRPFDTWAGTMMANALRDPLFLAALTVAEQDQAGAGTYCIRCHTPKGFVKGNASGVGLALDADDREGVDCESCHRSIDSSNIQPELLHDGDTVAALEALDPNGPYIGNARLVWDPRDVRHGPHADADSPAHAASPSAFTSSSEFCGQCHELQSPARNLLDANQADAGLAFPLDTTYTEWKSSAFSAPGAGFRSCIDCHMQRARAVGATTATFPSAASRDNPRTHLLVGGNEWGLEAVMFAYPELSAQRRESFELAREGTRKLLAEAIELQIQAPNAQAGQTRLELSVRVTNRAGHKFPTGYADGRRAFLQVEVLNAEGRSLALLGKYDDTQQRLAPDSVLRVWESVQAEHLPNGGHREWHIVRNDTVVKDTRIPPQGFAPQGAAVQLTRSVGADFGVGPELRNYDDVRVKFEGLPPLSAGQLTVVARVFYQSTTREFIEELVRANTTDDRGRRLQTVWEGTGKAAPRVIESSTITLQVSPAPTGTDDTGADGGSCQCRNAGPARRGASLWLLCVLVVPAAWRRRAKPKFAAF